MSKPKYLKFLAIVEEDYKPITGKVRFINDTWHCENVMTIKLKDDFVLNVESEELEARFLEFVDDVLQMAREKSNE